MVDLDQCSPAAAGCNYGGEEFRMLDVIYLLIGAVFLGGCALYAIACEHL